jgi:AcrR family transcriptional regulator
MNNVQQFVFMGQKYQRDKDQKIENIKRAFTQLINSKGYEKVTIRQIAKEAGTSVGIIYHYYPKGKPSIAAAIYEENLHEPIIIYKYEPDLKKLSQRIKNHLETHRVNFELYKAFDQAIISDQDVFSSVKIDRKKFLTEYAVDNNIPKEKVNSWLTTYNIIDALIHRHLYIDAVCASDQELINLIVKIYPSIISVQK